MIETALPAAGPARSMSVATPGAIPFRTDSAVAPATYGVALVVTLLVLGGLVAAVAWARRKGWVGMSGAMPGISTKASHAIEIKASRRLSMNTGVHVVAYEGRQFLIVESARSTHSTITPMDVTPTNEGAA